MLDEVSLFDYMGNPERLTLDQMHVAARFQGCRARVCSVIEKMRRDASGFGMVFAHKFEGRIFSEFYK